MEINDFDNKIKVLLEDLENIKSNLETLYSKKLLILYIHLYMEYFVSKMYEIKLSQIKKTGIDVESIKYRDEITSTLSLKNKFTHLIIWGVVDNKYFKIISIVNTARNKLAHNLNPNIEELEKEMKTVIDEEKPENDEKGLIQKYLNNTDLWVKWVPFAFATIFHLYEHIHLLNSTLPTYKLHMEITPDASSVKPILVNKTLANIA
jgi:hypothetical protein